MFLGNAFCLHSRTNSTWAWPALNMVKKQTTNNVFSKLSFMEKRTDIHQSLHSIPSENIPRVHLVFHVVEARIITVGYDCLAPTLEVVKVVDNNAAEKRAAFFQ